MTGFKLGAPIEPQTKIGKALAGEFGSDPDVLSEKASEAIGNFRTLGFFEQLATMRPGAGAGQKPRGFTAGPAAGSTGGDEGLLDGLGSVLEGLVGK